MCESRFCKFSDLELHIKQEHGNDPKQNCDKCEKSFVTAWRLRKHARIHSEKFTKTCKFFNRKTFCPFEELGCMFRHDISRKVTMEQHGDSRKYTIEQNNDSTKDTIELNDDITKEVNKKICLNEEENNAKTREGEKKSEKN